MRPDAIDLMQVPFLDLASVHRDLKEVLLEEFSALIDTSAFSLGPQVAMFEEAFASYCGAAHCVGVGSGLDALRLGLIAAGVEAGDEVIVPAATFAATFEAVEQAGAVPVVVDVSESDYCIDVAAAESAVTSRTRFLLPVHLYGQLADMRAVADIARRHGLRVIEDACQAHGASRDGFAPAAGSKAAAFSFYPAKNLGAVGDAGAVVTNDVAIAERTRVLREHGQPERGEHERIGFTSRLDTIQAAVLLRKLPLLDAWNEQRRRAALLYIELLDGVDGLRLPSVARASTHAWHLFVVRVQEADELAGFLAERRIDSRRHYPVPPHRAPAYAHLGHRPGSFPVTEALFAQCLSLPLFPGITDAQIRRVAAAVRDYLAASPRSSDA